MFLIGIEARRIQQYVLASPRLRDMVGASEIINRACDSLPRSVLARLGATESALRFGAAGRAWIVLEEERYAREFIRLWPVIIDAYAPGLNMPAAVAAWAGGPDSEREAIEKVRAALRAKQAWPTLRTAELSPLVERSARTAEEAVARGANGELVDEITLRQEQIGGSQATHPGNVRPPDGCSFPRDLNRIAGEQGGLAVVHADGNGVGAEVDQVLKQAERQGASGIAALAKFSENLLAANQAAVRQALQVAVYDRQHDVAAVSEDRELPVRPLVIGGDDVTVLLRSDLALPFVKAYVAAFASETQSRLGKALTACAGVVVVRPNHPFRRAYGLAESLCSWSKDQGRVEFGASRPSLVAFYRLTADVGDDYETILDAELTSRGNRTTASDRILLTSGPYALCAGRPFKSFEGLERVADALEQLPRGPRRELLTNLALGGADLQLAWDRLRELNPARTAVVGDALRAFHGEAAPVVRRETPLLDAHHLSLFRRLRA